MNKATSLMASARGNPRVTAEQREAARKFLGLPTAAELTKATSAERRAVASACAKIIRMTGRTAL